MIQHGSLSLPLVRNFFRAVVFWLYIYTTLYKFQVKAGSPNCQVINETSQQVYDLRPLTRISGDDWKVKSEGFNYEFGLNVCNVILNTSNVNQDDKVGIWGKKNVDKAFNLGNYNTNPVLKDDMLFLIYERGDECVDNNNFSRTTFIRFICDKTTDISNPPKLINEFQDCAFWFEWTTPFACPSKISSPNTGGTFSVFFTIFTIALIVYFIGGVVYNRMVYNASGIRQIPHWEFWSNLWDFVKDMFLIILAQCPMFQPRRRPGNYRNLPRDEEHILIDEEFEEH